MLGPDGGKGAVMHGAFAQAITRRQDVVAADDLTIVITFRLDRDERVHNLRTVLCCLQRTLAGAEIILMEAGSKLVGRSLIDESGIDPAGIRYVGAVENGCFHRTRMLNSGLAELSTRRFVAAYDTDTIAYPAAMQAALTKLREGTAFVTPFDGHVFDIRNGLRAGIVGNAGESLPSPAEIEQAVASENAVLMNTSSVGGVVIFDKRAFLQAGGYHEHFISWGYEDHELHRRFAKFGFALERIPGFPLLHLTHSRGRRGDGWYAGNRANKILAMRLDALDRSQLERLIASGAFRIGGPQPAPPTLGERLRALFF